MTTPPAHSHPDDPNPVHVIVWYDYIWPWCYVGLERVDKLSEEYDITVEGRAYFLRPDTPQEGRVREPRPGESDDELSDPIRTHAREANLVMRPPRHTPNSLYSLQATEYAQEQGKFMEYHHAAYQAYWDEQADLGDPSVLADIGTSVGLNGAELKERVESGQYMQKVVDQYHEALGYGIRGIPTFVVDNLLFSGAQPYEVFQRVIDKALENRSAAEQ